MSFSCRLVHAGYGYGEVFGDSRLVGIVRNRESRAPGGKSADGHRLLCRCRADDGSSAGGSHGAIHRGVATREFEGVTFDDVTRGNGQGISGTIGRTRIEFEVAPAVALFHVVGCAATEREGRCSCRRPFRPEVTASGGEGAVVVVHLDDDFLVCRSSFFGSGCRTVSECHAEAQH